MIAEPIAQRENREGVVLIGNSGSISPSTSSGLTLSPVEGSAIKNQQSTIIQHSAFHLAVVNGSPAGTHSTVTSGTSGRSHSATSRMPQSSDIM